MSKKTPISSNTINLGHPTLETPDDKSRKLRKYFAEALSRAQEHVKLVSAATEPKMKVLYQNPFFKEDSGSVENFVFYEKANEKPVKPVKKPTPKKDPVMITTYHCQYKGCRKALPLVPDGNRCKICRLEFCSLHRNPNLHEYKCGDILRGLLLMRRKSVQKLVADQDQKKYESEITPVGVEFRQKVAEKYTYLKFGESRRKHG